MQLQHNDDLTMKKTFERILLILCIIGLLIIILSWIL